jgi:hypothetical protein
MALCSLLECGDDLTLLVASCSLYVISEPGYIYVSTSCAFIDPFLLKYICIFFKFTRICFEETYVNTLGMKIKTT